MQEQVSIIVPVYKVEKYLSKCVESLLKQTYQNIEIILVDDGSPDICGKLCDEYAEKDKRVRVIHKKNGGLSDARNVAIPMASGRFIAFVDSDDWVSAYYVEHLYDAIVKDDSDLACSWFENVFEDSKPQNMATKELNDYRCLDRTTCLKKMLYQDGVECCAWGKLYKKEIIADLKYPVGKLYEDIPVTYQCVKRAHKVAMVSNVDYFYLQRKASIQYQNFNSRKLDGVNHCRQLMEAVKKDFPELSIAAECRYLSTVCNIMFQIQESQYKKELHILWNEIAKYRKDVLRDKEARKKTRLAALLSYCGYPTMQKIYKLTQERGGGVCR